MYNLKMSETHPSTICVLLDNFMDSLNDMVDVVTSPLPDESLAEYIEQYARTDEIMPDDRTVGFVIINKDKKVISLTFSDLSGIKKDEINNIIDKYKELGYKTEIEYPD
jgi:hypothetical protein